MAGFLKTLAVPRAFSAVLSASVAPLTSSSFTTTRVRLSEFKGLKIQLSSVIMNLVRGRLTVQTEKSRTQYRGIFHAPRTVFVEDGPRALYRGWLPSVIGITPLENLEPVLREDIQKVEVVALSSYEEKEEQFKKQLLHVQGYTLMCL